MTCSCLVTPPLLDVAELELHAVQLLLQQLELLLGHVRVQRLLHFALELDFAFPEENLALALGGLAEQLGLALAQAVDLQLEAPRGLFDFAQLLLEVLRDVLSLVLHGALFIGEERQKVVERVHLLFVVFERSPEQLDVLHVRAVLGVQAQLLLLEHDFLALEPENAFPDVRAADFLRDQLALLLDELALQLLGPPEELQLFLLELRHARLGRALAEGVGAALGLFVQPVELGHVVHFLLVLVHVAADNFLFLLDQRLLLLFRAQQQRPVFLGQHDVRAQVEHVVPGQPTSRAKSRFPGSRARCGGLRFARSRCPPSSKRFCSSCSSCAGPTSRA